MRGRGNLRIISQMEPQGCLVAEKTATAGKLEMFRSRRLLGGAHTEHSQNRDAPRQVCSRCALVFHSAHVEVGGQLVGISSFLLLGSCATNSGCQAW